MWPLMAHIKNEFQALIVTLLLLISGRLFIFQEALVEFYRCRHRRAVANYGIRHIKLSGVQELDEVEDPRGVM